MNITIGAILFVMWSVLALFFWRERRALKRQQALESFFRRDREFKETP